MSRPLVIGLAFGSVFLIVACALPYQSIGAEVILFGAALASIAIGALCVETEPESTRPQTSEPPPAYRIVENPYDWKDEQLFD